MTQKGDTYSAYAPRGQNNAVQDHTSTLVSGLYHDCSEGDGVSLFSFCNFLAHQRLLSWEFDHKQALEAFRQYSGGPEHPEDALDTALLDAKQFRSALQGLAIMFHGATYGLKAADFRFERQSTTDPRSSDRLDRRASGRNTNFAGEATHKIQALQDLLRDVSLRNSEVPFSLKNVSEQRTAFFDEQVMQTAYEYEHALRKLFTHYATEASTPGVVEDRAHAVGARSLYRLARAIRLVPDCVVAGEFHDVVQCLRISIPSILFSHLHADCIKQLCSDPSKSVERRFFEEARMLQHDEDTNWMQPAAGTASGEPRFWFPEMVEIFVVAAMHAPPRMYTEKVEDRVERIHMIFKDLLQLPQDEDGKELQADQFLQVASGLNDVKELQPDDTPQNLQEVLDALCTQLPKLAPKKDPHIPQPPANMIEKLPPQPLSVEQRLDETMRKNPTGRAAVAAKKKGRKKAKAAGKGPKLREHFYGDIPVKWNQVQWLGKRPEIPKPAIPPMWQVDRKISMLKHLDDHIERQREESSTANMPTSGWVLRLQLIDEPLQAPVCESEEVSTLMETALTSRRLRQYSVAMALLIRARKLWANLQAKSSTATEWQDVQAWVPTPSPWNTLQQFSRHAQEITMRAAPEMQVVHDMQDQLDATIHTGDMQRTEKPMLRSQTEALTQGPVSKDWSRSQTDGAQTFRGATHAGNTAGETRRPRTSSKSSQSARGRSPTCRMTETGFARSYNPKTDFELALGDTDRDLERLPPQASLFFFCELASLHSALQEDELAALLLWRAHGQCKRLSPHDVNTAMVWSGLGRVAFHSGNFEAAARLHMRARSVRERVLGGDTVDTATSYNNLACALAALDRPLEAAAFTELAVEILREMAGEDHPRTQTVIRNLAKVRTAPKKISMEAPCLYSLPLHDFTLALKGGRKKKKKGSRSGSSRSSKSSKSKK
ncbi:unnamed protein product [Effrenium voratum]|uniref:Uncharacterized protein n=1 Tax=Effrenium voratum TaxID=2562239 RepID=A0AA36HRY7_9DINO|nr:unnamed protein product [Effrenium voratum]